MKFTPRVWSLLFSVVVAINLPAAETAKPAAPAGMGEKVQGLAALLKATGLTEPQLLNGVKSGLGTAVDFATTELAKPGAFQLNGPASMAKLQTALVKANQSGALDSFKATLNQSAASVSPQAAIFLKESLQALAVTDVSGLASGGPDSATKLLRSVAEPVLRAKLRPLVSQAIAANGSAAKIKELAGKAGPFAAMLGVPNASDLEGYVLTQVIDTSFGYIAKGEATVREHPAALKDKVAAKIFSIGKK
jgi:hypothetical protein